MWLDALTAGIVTHGLHVVQHYASWSGLKELMRKMEGRVVDHINRHSPDGRRYEGKSAVTFGF